MFVASLNLINAAMSISETQAGNRVALSVWGSMAISVFSVMPRPTTKTVWTGTAPTGKSQDLPRVCRPRAR